MAREKSPVKVAFLGSRPISLKGLDIFINYLQKNPNNVDLTVFTKSDVTPPDGVVHWWDLGSLLQKAKENNFRLLSEENQLLTEGFDLVTMVFHNDIIPGNIVNVIPRGITNLHFGYLPSEGYSLMNGSSHKKDEPFSKGTYRGSNVLSHAILGEESWQAVTFHFISARIDLGPVIEYAWNPIDKITTAWDLQLASEEKAMMMFKKFLPLLIESPKKIITLASGKLKYPYYNRQSIDPLKIIDPNVTDSRLELIARALSFPNTEPPYFLEKRRGKIFKRYILYKKGKGITIMPSQEEDFIQRLEDIT